MKTDARRCASSRRWKVRAGFALALPLAAYVVLAPAAARGQDAPALRTVEFGTPGQLIRPGGDAWQASLGVRASLIRSAGFDPFSEDDALPQASLSVTRSLGIQPRTLVLALGLSLDLGHSDATTRGVDADLDLQRMAVVLEPRYLPVPGLFVGARLAPGVQRVSASLRDPSAPSPLGTSFWSASIDASLTAGMRLNPRAARAGVWLLAEGGYGWSPSHNLTLSPQLSARDSSKRGATPLGTLAPSAPFLRISVALSY